MTAVAVVALSAFWLLVGVGLGARIRGRRRFNAGHAAGRRFEAMLHGKPCEAVCVARPRRFWLRVDRKPDPEPLVTRDVPVSHPVVYDF